LSSWRTYLTEHPEVPSAEYAPNPPAFRAKLDRSRRRRRLARGRIVAGEDRGGRGQAGHADSKMTLDVYAQLEQRADRLSRHVVRCLPQTRRRPA
jgi:hypothetical protein